MAQFGIMIGLYLQKELVPQIDKILAVNQHLFKSRNHLINAAIMREIRRYKANGTLYTDEEEAKGRNPVST